MNEVKGKMILDDMRDDEVNEVRQVDIRRYELL